MIRIEQKERVLGVVLSRPEALNALTSAMLRELIAIVEGAGRSPEMRVIVVRGDGHRAFSAGYDIGSIPESGGAFEPEALLDGAADGLQQCPKPVIAMIRFARLGSCTSTECGSSGTTRRPPPELLYTPTDNTSPSVAKMSWSALGCCGGNAPEVTPIERLRELLRCDEEASKGGAHATVSFAAGHQVQ